MDPSDFKVAAEKIVSALREVDENQRLCLMKFGSLSDEQNLRTRQLLLGWSRLLGLVTEAKIDPQTLLPEDDWVYLQKILNAEREVAVAKQLSPERLDFFINFGEDRNRFRKKQRPRSTMPLENFPP